MSKPLILAAVVSLAAAGALTAQTATSPTDGSTAPSAGASAGGSTTAGSTGAAGGTTTTTGSTTTTTGSTDAAAGSGTAGSAAATDATSTAGGTTAPAAMDPAMANLTPQQFVEMAASGGMFEVKSSELALERSKSDEIQALAKMMIADHTKANEELKTLAAGKNLTVPTEPTGPAADHLKAVMAAEGDNFDAAYVEHQAKAHDEAIMLFQAQSMNSSDADLAAFAKKTLPTLQMHADHMKMMVKK